MTHLATPTTDLGDLTGQLGRAWGVTQGESIPQYLAWSERAGIFAALAREPALTIDELCAATVLNTAGADALLGILASLALVRRSGDGRYSLSDLAREYLVPGSPYYIGDGLYVDCRGDLPGRYSCLDTAGGAAPEHPLTWSVSQRLRIQHSRNFPPSIVAVRSGQFRHVTHLVDIAGGSGVFAIPLAQDYPDMAITLVETPSALDAVRQFLVQYGVADRITLVALDVFADTWDFGRCDGVVFGNFFHSVDDEGCRFLAGQSFKALSPHGRIWIHEVLFNEDRCGPLVAALWNANMAMRRNGARQRTASELGGLLTDAGFQNLSVTPTASYFSLVSGSRPA